MNTRPSPPASAFPRARAWLQRHPLPRHSLAMLLALVLLGGLATAYLRHNARAQLSGIVLLVPDQTALGHPVTRAWLDAAREEGLPVTPMTDDDFMRYGGDHQGLAGVMLPDTVHQGASDLLINQLHAYVRAGGQLFVAYDAALRDPATGRYAAATARLSALTGVRYARYGELGNATIATGAIYASREHARLLQLQPGKLDFATPPTPPTPPITPETQASLGELTTYGYEKLRHSFFRTDPAGPGTLMRSATGDVIVSTHRYGQGQVLFANLALGHLKTRTDAYLLHRLQHHFAVNLLQLPSLSAVPRAVGGMVLNLHVDSNAAQQPLLKLEREGWFNQGPFSLHITAGPDTYREGDGLGLDIDHNPVMQGFLQRMAQQGHEVGNHGGWIHNLFGENADDQSRERHEPWLERNHRSVSSAMGATAQVYSAPMGNQPRWATHWLQRQQFLAYYFTGDNGMGPTRSYDAGQPPDPSPLWAFPISSYQRIATFEELANTEPEGPQATDAPSAEGLGDFLTGLARYTAQERVVRLFYFHPPASGRYESTITALLEQAQLLAQQGRFRWYTMAHLSAFLNRREQTTWQIERTAQGTHRLSASNPNGLTDLSWLLPRRTALRPQVLQGQATVDGSDDTHWIVTAQGGPSLELLWREAPPQSPPQGAALP